MPIKPVAAAEERVWMTPVRVKGIGRSVRRPAHAQTPAPTKDSRREKENYWHSLKVKCMARAALLARILKKVS